MSSEETTEAIDVIPINKRGSSTANEIERFIRRCMLDDPDARLRRLELYHAQNHPSLLWRKEWGTGDELGGWAESGTDDHPLQMVVKLSQMVAEIAERDATHFKGSQRYKLVALDQHHERIGRHYFTLIGSHYDDSAGDETIDDGSSATMARKLLEVNLKLIQANQLGFANIIQTQQRMLADSQAHVERLQEERTRAFATIEAAYSEQHRRELEAAETRSSIEMREKAFDSIKMLMPAVVNRLAGKNVLPATDPKSLAIDELIGSITADQAHALASANILSTPQLAVILELINDRKKNTKGEDDGE